ncbi:MAG: hypothetical protein BGO98_20940 [Myxococcales bacterium 68-20]|nr:hypothetical protein [Myxococcales bacterium]OJY28031.1 MAG: hypothetical protein BGO98_20940 [Myxococcales bacterium 68-20]
MARTVDRSVARMIAYKRIVTGATSFALGVALIILLGVRGSAPPIAGLALLIFFGGGAWMLRDGLRLRRELLRS